LVAVFGVGTRMKKKPKSRVSPFDDDREPAWLKACNDRKSPYTEAELDRFVDDFIAAMHDVPAVNTMIESHGIRHTRTYLKERFRRRDKNNLVNMYLTGRAH
jgi:hypothetical protein